MYMAPVVRARPAVSPLTRRLVGVSVLLVSAAVMVPWLTIHAAVSGAVLSVQACRRAPRALVGAIDYAGEVVLGR